jgi:hypothetical protein
MHVLLGRHVLHRLFNSHPPAAAHTKQAGRVDRWLTLGQSQQQRHGQQKMTVRQSQKAVQICMGSKAQRYTGPQYQIACHGGNSAYALVRIWQWLSSAATSAGLACCMGSCS